MPFPAIALLAAKVLGGGGAAAGAGAAKGAASGGGGLSKLMSMGGSMGGGGGGGKENKPDYFDVNLGPWHDPKLKPGAPQANVNPPLQKHVPTEVKGTGPAQTMNTPDGDPLARLNMGLQALDMGKMSEEGFDINAHQERMLSTGPHAYAAARHSVWEQPVVAMNENQQAQLDSIQAGVLPGQRQAQAPGTLSTAPVADLPQGHAMSPEQLKQKNAEQDAIEARFLNKGKPAETEDQKLRRLGLK